MVHEITTQLESYRHFSKIGIDFYRTTRLRDAIIKEDNYARTLKLFTSPHFFNTDTNKKNNVEKELVEKEIYDRSIDTIFENKYEICRICDSRKIDEEELRSEIVTAKNHRSTYLENLNTLENSINIYKNINPEESKVLDRDLQYFGLRLQRMKRDAQEFTKL